MRNLILNCFLSKAKELIQNQITIKMVVGVGAYVRPQGFLTSFVQIWGNLRAKKTALTIWMKLGTKHILGVTFLVVGSLTP